MAYEHDRIHGTDRDPYRHEVATRTTSGWVGLGVLLAVVLAAVLLIGALSSPVNDPEPGIGGPMEPAPVAGDGVTAPSPAPDAPAQAVPEEILPGQPAPDAAPPAGN